MIGPYCRELAIVQCMSDTDSSERAGVASNNLLNHRGLKRGHFISGFDIEFRAIQASPIVRDRS